MVRNDPSVPPRAPATQPLNTTRRVVAGFMDPDFTAKPNPTPEQKLK